VFGDPINNSDPSGEFAAWFTEFSAQNAIEVAEAAAAREAAARQAAEEAARAAAAAANAAANAALFAREAEIHAAIKQSETEGEAETSAKEEGGWGGRAQVASAGPPATAYPHPPGFSRLQGLILQGRLAVQALPDERNVVEAS
jgi:hypothetical protein